MALQHLLAFTYATADAAICWVAPVGARHSIQAQIYDASLQDVPPRLLHPLQSHLIAVERLQIIDMHVTAC